MKKIISESVIGLAVAVLSLHAAATRADAIDEYVRAEMANQRLPGLALAVIRDGKSVKVGTYGFSNLELQVPVTRDTAFRLASTSKQIIAAAVLLLANDGKLTLEDPICKYLKDCPDNWRTIKVRHVLSHTSGLALEAPGNNPFQVERPQAVVIRGYTATILFPPGEKWAYSNLGYAIALEIIHQTSKEPWASYIENRLLKPLGMNSTRTTDLIGIVPNRADGYQFRDNTQRNVPPLLALRPGGPFLTTLHDMIQWDAGITAGKVITRAMRDQMWTPTLRADGSSTRYGFGFWADEVSGHRRVRHGGTQPGFRTEYSRFIDDGLSVIILVNGESVNPSDMAVEVANHFIPGLSVARKTTVLRRDVLSTYAGDYKFTDSNTLTIAVDGSGLSGQSSEGYGQFHLRAETANVFFISKDESYVFERDDTGAMRLEVRAGTVTSLGAVKVSARRAP